MFNIIHAISYAITLICAIESSYIDIIHYTSRPTTFIVDLSNASIVVLFITIMPATLIKYHTHSPGLPVDVFSTGMSAVQLTCFPDS